MNRSDARRLMSGYIDDRVHDIAESVFCSEQARLDAYQRSYRLARGFPERPPEPRQDTDRFHFGILSNMPTLELPTRRRQETEGLEEITIKTRTLQL
jgi:hypothetical protein